MRRMIFIAIVAVGVSAGESIASAPTIAGLVDIIEARALPAGTAVTVVGAVTAPTGSLELPRLGAGFAVQDRTGGIYVLAETMPGALSDDAHSDASHRDGLRGAPRDASVRDGLVYAAHARLEITGVTGVTEDGVRVLRPSRVKAVSARRSVPRPRAASQATGAIARIADSVLISIEGEITKPLVRASDYGYAVTIDDGSGPTRVFIAATTGISPTMIPFLRPGHQVQIVGLAGRIDGYSVVLPRFWRDIRPARAR